MALVYADRVKDTSTTTGTGTYTLSNSAPTGFQTFGAGIGNANTCYYTATDGPDWEVGLGTYTSAGTTLARTTILASSNANAAVNWGAGTRTLWCDLPARVISVPLGTANTTSTASVSLSGLTLTGYGQLLIVLNAISGSSTGLITFNGLTVSNGILAASDTSSGFINVDLGTGVFTSNVQKSSGSTAASVAGASGLSTASTSVTLAINAGNFDAGSFRVCGIT